MDVLIKSYKKLIESSKPLVKRGLFDEIDWDSRFIGIKGTRGIGKTTLLLNYAKEFHHADKTCLYVNLNNFYFTNNTLNSFTDEFYKTGGKTLLLDQINKYPNWANELQYCHETFSDLKIIFTCSPILELKAPDSPIKDAVDEYNLEGFSFREYLNYVTGKKFRPYTLEEILHRHELLVEEILDEVKPLAYFNDYLHQGFYPFFLENENLFSETLLKTINLILEIDVTYLNQVEIKYFYKIKKLLYLLGNIAPNSPNVSKLSQETGLSRATVMHYLYYLKSAKLIGLLKENDENVNKKPDKVYLQNPNLIYQVVSGNIDGQELRETFFFNQVSVRQNLESTSLGHFLVDKKYAFVIGDKSLDFKSFNGVENLYFGIDMIERGDGNTIPLWLFGFLY